MNIAILSTSIHTFQLDMHWYSIGCMFQLMLRIRWHDDTLRHQTHPKTLKMEVQAIISQVISRLSRLSRPSFWKSVDPMVSRTAPGEARRICNRSLKKSKTQSYAMLRDATRHRTGRSAWEEFLQKTGCKMIWIVEDRPFGGLAYGVWRDMARSLAGTCVSTVSTYFGITRRFSDCWPCWHCKLSALFRVLYTNEILSVTGPGFRPASTRTPSFLPSECPQVDEASQMFVIFCDYVFNIVHDAKSVNYVNCIESYRCMTLAQTNLKEKLSTKIVSHTELAMVGYPETVVECCVLKKVDRDVKRCRDLLRLGQGELCMKAVTGCRHDPIRCQIEVLASRREMQLVSQEFEKSCWHKTETQNNAFGEWPPQKTVMSNPLKRSRI